MMAPTHPLQPPSSAESAALPRHRRPAAQGGAVVETHRHARPVGARGGARRRRGGSPGRRRRADDSGSAARWSGSCPCLGATAAALVLAGIGSWLASRWLRRTTTAWPGGADRMYEYYNAVLHAVREGLLLLDRAGRLQLVNDEARRLLALPDDACNPDRRDRPASAAAERRWLPGSAG